MFSLKERTKPNPQVPFATIPRGDGFWCQKHGVCMKLNDNDRSAATPNSLNLGDLGFRFVAQNEPVNHLNIDITIDPYLHLNE